MTSGKIDKVNEQAIHRSIVNKYMKKLFMLNSKQKYKLKCYTFILLN